MHAHYNTEIVVRPMERVYMHAWMNCGLWYLLYPLPPRLHLLTLGYGEAPD